MHCNPEYEIPIVLQFNNLTMRKFASLLLLSLFLSSFTFAEEIQFTYTFQQPKIIFHTQYQFVSFDGLVQQARIGEPMLPYQAVKVLLPAGEKAVSIMVEFQDESQLDGVLNLLPRQPSSPISKGGSGQFYIDHALYTSKKVYPEPDKYNLRTEILNGHSIAMSSFSPVIYIPGEGRASWFAKAIVTIHTAPFDDSKAVLKNLSDRPGVKETVLNLVDNPDFLSKYPAAAKKGSLDMLIITPESFMSAFDNLRDYYSSLSLSSDIISPTEIGTIATGIDLQEKIRNYIIERYQEDDIRYVLLGGDIEHVPYRGFYCHVQSSMVYEDDDIPSDLYYASLDGSWNNNGNNLWGEPGEDDLLPEIAVARMPYSTSAEQAKMLNKVYKYQAEPVANELVNSLLAGEHLYDNPLTWGGDYLDLLIGYQDVNGYVTNGITPGLEIEKMYDRDMGNWSGSQLRSVINSGKTLIHHSGHSNYNYAMRMYNSDITDANFSGVNGTDHNYCIVYSHGCICGAFDYSDCIGENMLKIQNFAVAIAFNSRYGWFNEGQTEGPSAHLHREFVHSLYTLGYDRIGETQQHSKIRTAPWVTAPGQWEEGALRWCFYAHNILGDPAMKIHTDNLTGLADVPVEQAIMSISSNPSLNEITFQLPDDAGELQLANILSMSGQVVLTQDKMGSANLFVIDTSTLKPGLYILEVVTNSQRFAGKFLIE
jgi:hypothetical protein